MANLKFTNFAATTLASGILSGASSLTVSAGTGALFPSLSGSEYFYITLVDAATGTVKEIAKCTARSTDTFTITRAQEGTVASAFLAGDKVELRVTAASLNTLATTETDNTFTGDQSFTGDVILTGAGKGVIFEGTTADAYETKLVAGEPTADRTLTLPDATDTLVGKATTDTLTNKRITPRVYAYSAPGATPTINTDNYDIVDMTAIAAAITSLTTNLSGTPTSNQFLQLNFTDDGTARALTFGASFASSTITLPTTTVISTKLSCLFQWNTVTSKWVLVGKA